MIGRVLTFLFPSVPYADQARVLAAMEGRTFQTPGPALRGEAVAGPGHTTADPSNGGAHPEGGDRAPSVNRSPLSGAPEVERRVSQSFHPSLFNELSDTNLTDLLNKWGATS